MQRVVCPNIATDGTAIAITDRKPDHRTKPSAIAAAKRSALCTTYACACTRVRACMHGLEVRGVGVRAHYDLGIRYME